MLEKYCEDALYKEILQIFWRRQEAELYQSRLGERRQENPIRSCQPEKLKPWKSALGQSDQNFLDGVCPEVLINRHPNQGEIIARK